MTFPPIPDVRDWLPDGAFTSARIARALTPALGQWSDRWLPKTVLTVDRVVDGPAPPPAPGERAIAGPIASAILTGAGKRHLLEGVLSIRLPSHLEEIDHRLLDAFANELVLDLIMSVEAALPELPGAGVVDSHGLVLALSGEAVLNLTLPSAALVPLIKAILPETVRPRSKPRGRIAALGPTAIGVEGRLGQVRLTAEDVDALAVGDVLILDRSLEAPADLNIAPDGPLIARGTLGQNGGRVSLQLQPHP